jgi:hypothetical protein
MTMSVPKNQQKEFPKQVGREVKEIIEKNILSFSIVFI